VASAIPSISPTIAGPAPSVAVRKMGSKGVIISLDISFKKETSPRTITVRGRKNVFIVSALLPEIERSKHFYISKE